MSKDIPAIPAQIPAYIYSKGDYRKVEGDKRPENKFIFDVFA